MNRNRVDCTILTGTNQHFKSRVIYDSLTSKPICTDSMTMKLNIIKNTARELELQIEGEGHTLCNPLREILFEDEHLAFAGYSVPHPLEKTAHFVVRTDGRVKAITVFKRAAQKLIDRTEELRSVFQKALKAA